MAEQFLRGFALSLDKLHDLVGCKRAAILRRALAAEEIVEELDELLSEWGEGLTTRQTLEELCEGKLDRGHAYEYRRMLELLAELVGRPLEPVEVTLPGRGWHALDQVFPRLGLARVGKLWGRDNLPFPWRRAHARSRVDWPIATAVRAKDLPPLLEELRAFDPKTLLAAKLPARLGGDAASEDVLSLLAGLTSWVRTCSRGAGKDLLLLLDGQQ
jgi:hypothetical protein